MEVAFALPEPVAAGQPKPIISYAAVPKENPILVAVSFLTFALIIVIIQCVLAPLIAHAFGLLPELLALSWPARAVVLVSAPASSLLVIALIAKGAMKSGLATEVKGYACLNDKPEAGVQPIYGNASEMDSE